MVHLATRVSSLVIVTLVLFSSSPMSSITLAAAVATENLELCQVVLGYASGDHSQLAVNVKSAAFGLRANEAIVFVLRTPAEDDTVPQAQITAVYTQAGAEQTPIQSDLTTGVLQLGSSIGIIDSLTITVKNTAPTVDTPFILYSYHANFPSCGVPVQPGKIMSLPLTQTTADSTVPATAFFALSHPTGMDHYDVTIMEGGLTATLFTALTLSDSTIWVPAPSAGISGDLPLNPNPALPQILYLKVVPSAIANPATLRFLAQWKATAGPQPAPVPSGSGAGGVTVPAAVPVPGATSANGAPIPSTTADEQSTGSHVLWDMFVFVIVVIAVYFVARTAFNVSQGDREFPRYIPHHEEIGRGLHAIGAAVTAAAGKANVPGTFRRSATGYDDVDRSEENAGSVPQ